MIQYFTLGGNIVVFAAVVVVVVIFVFDLLGLVYLLLPIVGSKIDLLLLLKKKLFLFSFWWFWSGRCFDFLIWMD